MKTHDSSINIDDKKLCVLLYMDCFSNSMIIYVFHQTNQGRSNGTNFVYKFPAKILASIKK